MVAQNRLKWLDGQMADGREYICGKRFTLADIFSMAGSISAARSASRSIAPTRNIAAWFDRDCAAAVGEGVERSR